MVRGTLLAAVRSCLRSSYKRRLVVTRHGLFSANLHSRVASLANPSLDNPENLETCQAPSTQRQKLVALGMVVWPISPPSSGGGYEGERCTFSDLGVFDDSTAIMIAKRWCECANSSSDLPSKSKSNHRGRPCRPQSHLIRKNQDGVISRLRS